MTEPHEEPIPDEELAAADDEVIGVAFKLSLAVFAVVGTLVAAGILIFGGDDEPPPVQETDVAAPEAVRVEATAPAVRFTDVTESAGIAFRHENGARGDKLLPETMGGGSAFFDADQDGDVDLFLVNSDLWPEHAANDAGRPTSSLYLNRGDGTFEDAGAGSGLDVSLYGMGAATADVDADGDQDVLITAVGENLFLTNDGSAVFTDATASSSLAGSAEDWSTCASFFDADGDGDLDLYVGNYVRWSREIDFAIDYRLTGLGRSYGPPSNFQGTHSYFYRGDGSGGFAEVGAEVGLHVLNPATSEPMGKALGCLPVDTDLDGDLDLMVANDTVQNFFFENAGDGTFVERGASYGVAFDRNGASTGAMGVDGGDFRNDGNLGFAIGNFANEMTSLYVSQGRPDQFADESIVEGLGPPTRLVLSFGVFFFDYDLDGRLDLFQANGHLEDEINKVQPSQHYEQPPQLFWNAGPEARRAFVEVARATTVGFERELVGRGASFADIDGDADLDVLVTQVGGAPLLLRNDQDLGHHWLRVRLVGSGKNLDAIGARIRLEADGVAQRRHVMPSRSYLSQMELTQTFGLGTATAVERLVVTWPDGEEQVVEAPPIDQLLTLRRDG